MSRRFLIVMLLLSSSSVLGAPQSQIMPSHSHESWKAAAGFPIGYAYSVTQTSDGYLWIGTSKGLLRYDGLSFVPVRVNDTNAGFPVLAVITDSSGQLWAVDDHTHLFRYANGGLVGPVSDNGRHQYLKASVNRTRDGWLLFVSKVQGLVEYERGQPRILLDPSLLPNWPMAVAQTGDGTFWIGTLETGLFRVNATQGVGKIEHVPGLGNLKINCLLPLGTSTLLIGTKKGLFSLHDGKLAPSSTSQLGNVEILALAHGQHGDVWIATGSHLFKAHAKDIQQDGRIDSLDHLGLNTTVTALFEDRDANLWIGGTESIERYRDSGFTTYLSSDGLPSDNCGAIYVDPQQRIWFAPWDGGLYRLSQGKLERIEAAGLMNDTAYSIAGGARNEVWVARKYGGVTRLLLQNDSLQATTYTKRSGLAQDAVDSIYRAADGSIWAGTLDAGLSRFDGTKWHTYTARDGLPSDRISVITGDAAGNIFLGTPNGLAIFKNNQWLAYTARDGLPPGAVQSLFLDQANTLWIGTSKGIAFLQSGAVHVPIGAPNALYGEILGIAESNGWLWITTRDHVLRTKAAALLKQSYAEEDYREFGVSEGLPSTEGVKRSPSLVEDSRGQLWFSLNRGISVLQPLAFAAPAFPVTTRVDGIVVDGTFVASADGIRIPPGRHRLTFRYAGVNVSNPDGVRYRYRLDTVDSAWSEPTALREIDYTNVPPGQLQFHVVARNPDGVWSTDETTMAFQVEPEYWQTRWFQIASLVALLLIVVGLYRSRLQQLHRQFNVGLEARVNERTRIARELHDTLLQSFHGLMFQFQAARNMLPRRPEEAMQALDGAIGATEQAITASRGAIQDLRSENIAQSDLEELLTTMGQELTNAQNIKGDSPIFRVIVEGERRTLAPVLQSEVCRIAQEILRNAFHHAQAHRIEAEIRYDDQALRLRIRDDGKGLDPKVLEEGGSAGHWGLRGVRERAQQIGARLDLWSEMGAGTEIQVAVPAAVAYKTSRGGSRSKLLWR
jgi:signal transduction histidine kinase/ligand-binding sensor domain-containing protein